LAAPVLPPPLPSDHDRSGERSSRRTFQAHLTGEFVAPKVEPYHGRDLLVRRKGATRAFPAGSSEIPEPYRTVGQPVFIPGSMGTSSFVLAGAPGSIELAFGSTCHGAGRKLSRTGARNKISGAELCRQLEGRGIVVRSPSNKGLAEEAPIAHKDVERVVNVVERAGLSRRVAQLISIGVIKGRRTRLNTLGHAQRRESQASDRAPAAPPLIRLVVTKPVWGRSFLRVRGSSKRRPTRRAQASSSEVTTR
jgi:hypothetical protein